MPRTKIAPNSLENGSHDGKYLNFNRNIRLLFVLKGQGDADLVKLSLLGRVGAVPTSCTATLPTPQVPEFFLCTFAGFRLACQPCGTVNVGGKWAGQIENSQQPREASQAQAGRFAKARLEPQGWAFMAVRTCLFLPWCWPLLCLGGASGLSASDPSFKSIRHKSSGDRGGCRAGDGSSWSSDSKPL